MISAEMPIFFDYFCTFQILFFVNIYSFHVFCCLLNNNQKSPTDFINLWAIKNHIKAFSAIF